MKKSILRLSIAAMGVLMLSACGSGGDSSSTPNDGNSSTPPPSGGDESTIHNLAPQSGTQSNMFYGNSLHSGLGSLKNVKTIKVTDISSPIVSKEIDDKKPSVGTSFTYANGNYTDLHMDADQYNYHWHK